MLKEEFRNLKNLCSKHKKNLFFYIWNFVVILLFWKGRYVYLIFTLFILFFIIFLLIKKNPTITLSKNKINLFFNYIIINSLRAMQSSKFNKNTFFYIIFFYIFRTIVGVSYKFVKMSIVLFDCFHREYKWSDIKKKKKNYKIMKKYAQNSFENFFFIEFIKKKPNTKEDIHISLKYFSKIIKIKNTDTQ